MKVYTDASTHRKKGISGLAFIATNSKNEVLFKRAVVAKIDDNNTAELAAIFLALTSLKHTDAPITILTDSTYAKNAILNNTCRESERELLDNINLNLEMVNCEIMWIKGHCRDDFENILSFYNKRVDKDAKKVVYHYFDRKKQAILKNARFKKTLPKHER